MLITFIDYVRQRVYIHGTMHKVSYYRLPVLIPNCYDCEQAATERSVSVSFSGLSCSLQPSGVEEAF